MSRRKPATPTLPPADPISPQSPAVAAPRPGPQIAQPAAALRNGPEIYENEPGEDDTPENQAARRAQAVKAAYQFAGTPLKKFSMGRKRLLLDIRGASAPGPFGRRDSLFGDALRFTWLCLQDDETLRQMKFGFHLPGLTAWPLANRFQEAIDVWADANDEVIRLHQTEMVDTFLEAWEDTLVTEAIPESAANSNASDDVGN